MIHKPSLSLVVVLVGCFVAPVSAIPLQDPEERPGGDFTCDPGHLFAFPVGESPSDFFAPVHLASPPQGGTGVPRNVEIVLGGFVSDLDAQPPFLLVTLRDALDDEVPSTRNGNLLRPRAPLAPFAVYRVRIDLADPDSCPDCGFEQVFSFTTGGLVDVEPPHWSGELLAQAFVLSQQDRNCGFGGGPDTTHLLLARLPPLLGPDIARISVAVRAGGGATARHLDALARPHIHELVRSGREPLALGDEVIVALTPIDFAGNAGAATSVRVRARPFGDLRDAPFDDLSDQQCSLPTAVQTALPTSVPSNARFVVDMPVEPVPLALVSAADEDDDDVTVPLHPVEHLPSGQVLVPGAPLPPGASLRLVTLPCTSCACIGCNLGPSWTFTVDEDPDERAPAPPVVTGLIEDLDPPPALDACHADQTALVVLLDAGEDDTTAAEHLRYDAVLRLADQLAVEAGRALPALLGADGSVAVRVDTSSYGRLLSQPFELDLLATDLAGNRSSTTVVHDGAAAGCTSTRVPTRSLPLTGLLFVALAAGLALRRRERSSVR